MFGGLTFWVNAGSPRDADLIMFILFRWMSIIITNFIWQTKLFWLRFYLNLPLLSVTNHFVVIMPPNHLSSVDFFFFSLVLSHVFQYCSFPHRTPGSKRTVTDAPAILLSCWRHTCFVLRTIKVRVFLSDFVLYHILKLLNTFSLPYFVNYCSW